MKFYSHFRFYFLSLLLVTLFPIQSYSVEKESKIGKTHHDLPFTDPHLLGHLYQLMRIVDHVLTKNKIDYWAAYGTLLGLERHQGIIPWDDDLDIQIFQKDRKKVLNLENQFKRYGVTFRAKKWNHLQLYLAGDAEHGLDIFPVDYNKSKRKYEGAFGNAWKPKYLTKFTRKTFGPISMKVPKYGVKEHLLGFYGKDCLEYASYKSFHREEGIYKGKFKITDLEPAEYVWNENMLVQLCNP